MPYKQSVTRVHYVPLQRRLVHLTEDIAKALRELRKPLVSDRILLAFLGKAADTLRGVCVLQSNGLCHEAQALARTLFELRLSFDAFAEMLADDVHLACARVMDTLMLEKIKQARASDFKGLDPISGRPLPKDLFELERQIAGRYSSAELKSLRQYGFTGLNVEQRAQRSGLSNEYNIAYRNFSRNVHSTDFTELLLQEDPDLIPFNRGHYLESRDAVCCELACMSVVGIAARVNDLARLRLDRRFRMLQKAWDKVRCATSQET